MNYEEYLEAREKIIEENDYPLGIALNETEEKANDVLERLKTDVRNTVGAEHLYKMSVLRDEKIYNSDLYEFIKKMPKGSDLHVHATALLPAHKLIDFVLTRNELVVDTETCHIYNKKETYPENRFTLKECFDKKLLTRDEVETKWTMKGVKHGENVWEYFENLLCLFESIEYDEDTLYEYYVYSFEDYLKNGTFHIEIHAVFSENYERTVCLANTIKRAYFHVKDMHPELIVSVICAGLKYDGIDFEVPKLYLKNALKLKDEILDDYDKDNIHNFIIGFDLLNEEDKSIPLKEFAPMLLECKEKHPDFGFFIHCGESLDAQSNNLIDAYLLKASRVGHGMNLYRYPKLLRRYAEAEICLESCLISNQTLKYVKDLRLHPGYAYLKRGVAVALCSDDPVCQEREQLSDDFFAAVVCWDLSISEIKQLCVNSIFYSGIDKKQKHELMSSWKRAWAEFCKKTAECE